ncbi:MAG: J-domain-containing protein [Blastocatellia bacterium]
MSIESAIEEMIRQAIARGEFDNLEGKGKPLDLDAYFNTPEEVRMGFSILKANDFVPEEVEWLKEIAVLREKIKNSKNEDDTKALTKELRDKSLAFSMILERNRRKS